MEFLNVVLPEEISREEKVGNYETAKFLVRDMLSKKIPDLLRKRLEYEFERIGRILSDYPFDESKAKDMLSKTIKDFSNSEYDELLKNGRVDYIIRDGEKYFEKRFVQNLVFSDDNYAKRYDNPRNSVRELVNNRISALINGAKPRNYSIIAEETLTLKEHMDGKILRCYLPFPKVKWPITYAKLIECDHEYKISSNNSNSRTIYMEDKPELGATFTVKFKYIINEQVNHVELSKISEETKMKNYLSEKPPHILFTPYVKALVKEIVGKETNPYLKAKYIYDWITGNIRYSYMHAYSTYDMPLVDFAISNLKGDCGVQALTFITMCRSIGIPSKWESGWFANPIDASPHDWAYFYVKPYGWLPVDSSFGGSREGKLRDFYFGNLDAFRMIANSDFMADFDPPKVYVRSDPYDNQSGEIESDKENIYYKYFDTKIKILDFISN